MRIGFELLTCGSLAAVLVVSGCHRSKPAAGPPPPALVTTAKPVEKQVVEWDEFPGRMDAVDSVEIRARVSGYLESIHFKEGTIVQKGDLLFVIDPRPYEAEVAREEATLNQTQTRLEWTSNEVTRAERLVKARAMSEEEADSRLKARREAEAGVQSARAALDVARLNLEYTRITAPITGRISRKMMTEGNLVNGNQGQSTLLTTIVSLDPIYCYFDADERAILKYQQLSREGKSSDLRQGHVACELELANEKGFPHRGRLDFMDNRVNPATGTLRVRAVFPNPAPDFVLQPGFFARVRVPGSAEYAALLVPEQAIGTDQGQKFVYVVNDKDQVQYKRVELGPLFEGLRVIRDGLIREDWVVVNGLMKVRPGALVKPERTNSVGGMTTPLASAHP